MSKPIRKPTHRSRRNFLGQALTAAGAAIAVPKLLEEGQVAEAARASDQDLEADSRLALNQGKPLEGAIALTLKVNGQNRLVKLEPRVTLLEVLREQLGLTGSKKGCDHGQCGACTVLVDGERIYACLALAIMQEGREITTIEGLAQGEQLHPVQAAFIEQDGFQCGYCTPGQICATMALLREVDRGAVSLVTPDLNQPPSRATLSSAEIRERLSGNLCRCSAYNGIVAAVQQAIGQTPPVLISALPTSEAEK